MPQSEETPLVLVVDDDDTLLKFFKIHLNKFFSKVIVVRNAKEAVAALKEKEIDLVLSDIRMPRMDGIQFMKKVRAHDPTIPVYLVSGALLSPEQTGEIENQADGFLKKPHFAEGHAQVVVRFQVFLFGAHFAELGAKLVKNFLERARLQPTAGLFFFFLTPRGLLCFRAGFAKCRGQPANSKLIDLVGQVR